MLTLMMVIVGLANFRIGRWIAMSFRPSPFDGRPAPGLAGNVTALVVVIGAFALVVRNRQAQLTPFTFRHATVLAACTMLGYSSIRARQRYSQPRRPGMGGLIPSVKLRASGSESFGAPRLADLANAKGHQHHDLERFIPIGIIVLWFVLLRML